jgi:hypothetical protein
VGLLRTAGNPASDYAATSADLQRPQVHAADLEQELERLRSSRLLDQAGEDVASILRAFTQSVETAKRRAEHHTQQALAEAKAQADQILEIAATEAQRVRTAAQDANDQAVSALNAARAETRRVRDELRANAETITNEAREEAARLVEQARAVAEETATNAQQAAAREIQEAQIAAAELLRMAQHDASILRNSAKELNDESTAALEATRHEQRRLLEEARAQVDAIASEARGRASAHVHATFTTAGAAIQKLQDARGRAIRALEICDRQLRDVSRSLETLADIKLELPPAGTPEEFDGPQRQYDVDSWVMTQDEHH